MPTGVNVKQNNNIVTRNTEVFDSIGTNKTTPEWVLRMGNQWGEKRKIRLTIENPVTNFWDLGYYVVELDDAIFDAWVAGSSVGNGYTLSGKTFYVYSDSFYLDNIVLNGNQWGWAHFQFRLHDSTTITADRGQQLFSFVQYSSPLDPTEYTTDGGFNFLLNLEKDTAYVPPHVDSLSFSVYPNPINVGNITVGVTTNFSTTEAVLNLYDFWGNPVISEVSLGTINEGYTEKSIDIGKPASGTYSMVITANGINYSQIVIVEM